MTRYLVLSYFLLASFYTTICATVQLVVVGGSSARCSDSTVTFNCTLSGNTLTWNTPHGALNFVRGRPGDTNTEFYQSHFEDLNSTHLTSTLSFTYTSKITINCSIGNIYDSITLRTEGPPGAPERLLTFLERIERVNKTFSSVSVVWNIPTTNNAHISSYVVTVDPPISLPDGVIAADNPLFNTRQLTLTLQHDQQYNISVRANSCNDRMNGTTSDHLTVNIQVPQPVTRCTAVIVYDYYSNNLTLIKMELDPSLIPEEMLTNNITANVQSYIITLVPDIGVSINLTLSSDSCADKLCTYSHFFTSYDGLSGNISVSVTAKNLLSYGYSERRECSNIIITIINQSEEEEAGKEDNADTLDNTRENTSQVTIITSDNGMTKTKVELEIVVTIVIPSVFVLCIISCVSGALFFYVTASCCRKSLESTTAITTSQPSKALYYDVIELHSGLHTEGTGTTSCRLKYDHKEEIETTPNDAYSVTKLS